MQIKLTRLAEVIVNLRCEFPQLVTCNFMTRLEEIIMGIVKEHPRFNQRKWDDYVDQKVLDRKAGKVV